MMARGGNPHLQVLAYSLFRLYYPDQWKAILDILAALSGGINNVTVESPSIDDHGILKKKSCRTFGVLFWRSGWFVCSCDRHPEAIQRGIGLLPEMREVDIRRRSSSLPHPCGLQKSTLKDVFRYIL